LSKLGGSGATLIYTDDSGRDWVLREFVEYAGKTPPPGELPRVANVALVFASDGECRVAEGARSDWRARDRAVDELFARAKKLSERFEPARGGGASVTRKRDHGPTPAQPEG
jgi:hypothetical protein